VHAQAVVDQWQYTLTKPGENWTSVGFDDAAWETADGGFGTRGTPGARIVTRWETNDIWLRKFVSLESISSKPAILIHHDEDAEVFINGESVLKLNGFVDAYQTMPLTENAINQLHVGRNLIAVHCRQTTGGQFIDAHLIDASSPPELPRPAASTRPFESDLITEWGEFLTPQNAWTEYPRPQMQRSQWQNLNGLWDYAVTADSVTEIPNAWAGDILVPFCLESKLGGVQRLLSDREALWYRRSIEIAKIPAEKMLLHFEAVDYACEVFINGQRVGTHVGGNIPFAFDISNAVVTGQNQLVVRVEDDTLGYQLHGKQAIDPQGIFYTQVSGIWQTVWLEKVPATYIEDVTVMTDAADGTITVRVDAIDAAETAQIRVAVFDSDDQKTRTFTAGELLVDNPVAVASADLGTVTVTVPGAKLWTPDSPHLYDLEISLLGDQGTVLDRVVSYAGIRTVGKRQGDDGHWRMTLNGEEIFHWGPLDQGWWPDGLLTPPSDEGMLFDIEYVKSSGFNMIRKHIKVEPRRYYYHCDRLGVMVWQDQVSCLRNPPWTRLRPDPKDAEWPADAHRQYMAELELMIDNLESHPSIVVWVPFNEAWGQHQTMEVGEWLVERDRTRIVNVASGGNFWPIGDMADQHAYPDPEFPFNPERFGEFIKVVGEFGGHGLPVQEHIWDVNKRNWGYGSLPKTKAEYQQRYITSLNKLVGLKQDGIAAGVYTQTTDVEGEINGLMTYDRKVIKFPADQLRELHQKLLRNDAN
jgi:beta-galactosidase